MPGKFMRGPQRVDPNTLRTGLQHIIVRYLRHYVHHYVVVRQLNSIELFYNAHPVRLHHHTILPSECLATLTLRIRITRSN